MAPSLRPFPTQPHPVRRHLSAHRTQSRIGAAKVPDSRRDSTHLNQSQRTKKRVSAASKRANQPELTQVTLPGRDSPNKRCHSSSVHSKQTSRHVVNTPKKRTKRQEANHETGSTELRRRPRRHQRYIIGDPNLLGHGRRLVSQQRPTREALASTFATHPAELHARIHPFRHTKVPGIRTTRHARSQRLSKLRTTRPHHRAEPYAGSQQRKAGRCLREHTNKPVFYVHQKSLEQFFRFLHNMLEYRHRRKQAKQELPRLLLHCNSPNNYAKLATPPPPWTVLPFKRTQHQSRRNIQATTTQRNPPHHMQRNEIERQVHDDLPRRPLRPTPNL